MGERSRFACAHVMLVVVPASRVSPRGGVGRHGSAGEDGPSPAVTDASDFTRAWQTADESLSAVQRIVEFEQQACEFDDTRPYEECALLATPDEGVVRTPLLRERWFGELDALPLKNYNQVWPRDLVSAAHDHCGVESK